MPHGTISDREFDKFVDTTNRFKASSALVVAGGTGYHIGDVLTLVGGTFSSAATFQVAAVSSGSVTAVIKGTSGAYTVVPANPVSTTGGTGTGATLTVTFDPQIAVVVVNADGTPIFSAATSDLPATPVTGQVSVTTAASQMPSVVLTEGAILTNTSSSSIVYFGTSNAVTSSTGSPLAAGSSTSVAIANLNALWVIGSGSLVVGYIGS